MNPPVLRDVFPSAAAGLKSAVTLNNGGKMPWLGLGVFQVDGDAATATAVRHALRLGYRSIDTAALYRNESGVGEAVRTSGLPRSELFVTTKVWNDDIRANRIEAALVQSLKLLGLDYVDLYLLHWPIRGQTENAWRVMEQLYRDGRVRAIGVSNYLVPQLEELLVHAEVVPAVNQIEFHPWLQSKPLHAFCNAHQIRLEAWAPLMQGGDLLRDPVLVSLAAQHRRTVAQIILRWNVQLGVVTIPKSVHPERIAENADIFGFALDDAAMAAIAALDRGQRKGPDPLNFNF